MIYLLQLDERVPPGRFEALLNRAGVRHRVVRLFAGDNLPLPGTGYGTIVFGGYMGVNDNAGYPYLVPLKEFLRQAAEEGSFLLGICLGGQLLAAALGGTVHSGSRGEKGLQEVTLTAAGRDDPLFAGLPERFDMFQWHNDSFDLPPGGVALASSAVCAGQAFRVRNAWGVQFHPEVDGEIVARWSAPADPSGAFLMDFRRAETVHGRLATRMLGNFLAGTGSARQ